MLKVADMCDGRLLEPKNSLSTRYLTGCRSMWLWKFANVSICRAVRLMVRTRFQAELQGRILPVQERGICNRWWWRLIYKRRMCGKLEFMRNRASRDGREGYVEVWRVGQSSRDTIPSFVICNVKKRAFLWRGRHPRSSSPSEIFCGKLPFFPLCDLSCFDRVNIASLGLGIRRFWCGRCAWEARGKSSGT